MRARFSPQGTAGRIHLVRTVLLDGRARVPPQSSPWRRPWMVVIFTWFMSFSNVNVAGDCSFGRRQVTPLEGPVLNISMLTVDRRL